ncbi:putative zinc-binding metallopeptidase [Candidatus Absconditicoccus praedator]|uniref:putative zinc-binding metallopeptidase n=1 Tax=Candidatus Absconditicoccus praedator TaxID=2735562 RepID=UPI001E5F7548|nr:putative zinc-binding metallopeptidase [Candidatus Absconditicoccus praedator]UFX82969.1 hypothetical protein HLG78_02440 [Candidatus Absconditicoccus praedator]
MKKLLIKIFLGSLIIYVGLFGFPQEVGDSSNKIKYDRAADFLIGKNLIEEVESFEKIKAEDFVKDESDMQSIYKESKEKAKQTIEEIVDSNNDEQEVHTSPVELELNEETYSKLCSIFVEKCRLTGFHRDIQVQDRVLYQALMIYLMKNIDDFLDYERGLIETIRNINVTQKSGRRGYAGHHNIMMNIQSIPNEIEFMEVFVHELGHIIDLGVLRGSGGNKHTAFTEFGEEVFYEDDPSLSFYSISWEDENTRKASARREDFVGGYAMTNPFEDFAETVNMYINHYGAFRQMANYSTNLRRKFMFMERLFGGDYINYDQQNKQKVKSNPERRPRDTTKMYN